MKSTLFLLLFFVFAGTAHAQLSREDAPDTSGSTRSPQANLGSPGDEMRYRAAVRHEEESHREVIERADEISEISSQLLKKFDSQQSLSRDDLKRLERVEKLTRKIRGNSGGSDPEKQLDSPPQQLDAALTRLSEVSEQLNEGVKKTSRMVVSVAVIERSNELLQIIKIIRNFVRP